MGQKNTFFEKRTGEVIENKGSAQKTNRNEPKNEAGKLLKTRSCGKNKAKNKAEHLIDKKGLLKNEPKTNRRNPGPYVALTAPIFRLGARSVRRLPLTRDSLYSPPAL